MNYSLNSMLSSAVIRHAYLLLESNGVFLQDILKFGLSEKKTQQRPLTQWGMEDFLNYFENNNIDFMNVAHMSKSDFDILDREARDVNNDKVSFFEGAIFLELPRGPQNMKKGSDFWAKGLSEGLGKLLLEKSVDSMVILFSDLGNIDRNYEFQMSLNDWRNKGNNEAYIRLEPSESVA